jgi:hypothetical protein
VAPAEEQGRHERERDAAYNPAIENEVTECTYRQDKRERRKKQERAGLPALIQTTCYRVEWTSRAVSERCTYDAVQSMYGVVSYVGDSDLPPLDWSVAQHLGPSQEPGVQLAELGLLEQKVNDMACGNEAEADGDTKHPALGDVTGHNVILLSIAICNLAAYNDLKTDYFCRSRPNYSHCGINYKI